MLKEISLAAALTASMTGSAQRRSSIYLEELDPIRERLAGIDRVELIACGTAYYASLVRCGRCSRSGSASPPDPPSRPSSDYSPPPIDARTLVVAVDPSGETADTIAAARLAGDRGAVSWP